MSDRRSRKVACKKKKTLKKEFLLTSKKCWLIDEKLLPLYQHLVDSYSVKLREDCTARVEESDIDATAQVKEEPQDEYFMEPQSLQLNSPTNPSEVIISLDGLNILFGPALPPVRPSKPTP